AVNVFIVSCFVFWGIFFVYVRMIDCIGLVAVALDVFLAGYVFCFVVCVGCSVCGCCSIFCLLCFGFLYISRLF
ncbi:hypothetical protein Q4595_23945, partial [Wenyingzhuangia sp. 1_MG-2023]|nr:hypothetical protein [Wenyingzhuangia sp. 1_MG-2023]